VSTLNLGIVGLGNWGNRLANAVAGLPDVNLRTCFARSLESRSAFAAKHGCEQARSLEAFLAEPLDGILVATPHSTHRGMVEAITGAGRNVMVEKPLALTTADARACLEAADRAGVILQVAHYRRRLSATRALKSAIDEGRLGRVHALEGWFSRVWGPQAERPWRDDPGESPLGGMTALGVHIVDNFHYLNGRIARVACLSRQVEGITDIDDITMALFDFENGAIGQLGTSLRIPFKCTTSVFGSQGAGYSLDDGTKFLIQERNDRGPIEVPIEPVEGVSANLAAFCEAIRTGTAPETDGRVAFAVVAVMEAMGRSAADGGRPVDVETAD
jgi:predicted dehydrogenase